ncbi:hypothetical protein N9213_02695 [Akkermansiaceae bacterium]|nr:hypothetical protein [Akkermansiaceae bacterium]
MSKNILTVIILGVAALVAIYLGLVAATGDFVTISAWGGAILFLTYLLKGQNYSLEIYLFLIWGGISFYWGFSVISLHIVAALFSMHVISSVALRRRPIKVSGLFKDSGQGFVILTGGIFILYGFVHILLLRASPQIPGEFSMANSAKAYFKAFVPVVILLLALGTRVRFKAGEFWARRFFLWLSLAVVMNGAYLGYLYFNGFSSNNTMGMDRDISMIYIPLINAAPHHFAFRNLGPIAVLFSLAFLTERGWYKGQGVIMKSAVLVCFLGGLIGSLGSGGRGSFLLCLVFIILVAFYRKNMIIIFGALVCSMAVVAFANLFSGFVNEKAPLFVARPLQYFMVDKGESAVTIESSTNQRIALFEAALAEWQSDPRIFIIGRGVYPYKYSFEDLRATLGEEGAFLEVNLRAGTCHALLPSSLLQYGIIGTGIYFTFLFALIWLAWNVYTNSRRRDCSKGIQTASFCLFIYFLTKIPLEIIAGGWLDLFFVVMLILVRTRVAEEEEALNMVIEEERGQLDPKKSPDSRLPRQEPAMGI